MSMLKGIFITIKDFLGHCNGQVILNLRFWHIVLVAGAWNIIHVSTVAVRTRSHRRSIKIRIFTKEEDWTQLCDIVDEMNKLLTEFREEEDESHIRGKVIALKTLCER